MKPLSLYIYIQNIGIMVVWCILCQAGFLPSAVVLTATVAVELRIWLILTFIRILKVSPAFPTLIILLAVYTSRLQRLIGPMGSAGATRSCGGHSGLQNFMPSHYEERHMGYCQYLWF